MMKKIAVLLIMMLVIPIAMADVVLDNVKGYVNGKYTSDIDKTGGTYEVYPGDRIQLKVYITNNGSSDSYAWINNELTEIDNGDTLESDVDRYTVSNSYSSYKTIDFTIPTNADTEESYTLVMEIRYRYPYDNTTDNYIIKNFDVYVQEPDEETTTATSVSTNDILVNMTYACNNIADSTLTCFGFVDKSKACADELSTVKEERGRYQQQATDCDANLIAARAELMTMTTAKTDLQNQMEYMVTNATCTGRITAEVIKARSEESSKSTTMFIGIAVIVGGYLLWQQNKKKKEEVASSFSDMDHPYR